MTTREAPQTLLFGVNVDHVATLREARGTSFPDPVEAAFIAADAGADIITVHLREDRRHIQDRDVEQLKETLSLPLNLEMAVTEEMLGIAERLRPEHCCLVPERREELTTEGGLNVARQADAMREACARLAGAGVHVSLFIDPESAQVEAAVAAGAPAIELHTGSFANAQGEAQARELERIVRAVEQGRERGLEVHAGHGLDYDNVGAIACIGQISELHIGHSIVARAIFDGLGEAVRDMRRLMTQARIEGRHAAQSRSGTPKV